MPPHADAIADCVLAAFHALPAKCKPRQLADGRREWVPMAGIVLSRGTNDLPHTPSPDPLVCRLRLLISLCSRAPLVLRLLIRGYGREDRPYSSPSSSAGPALVCAALATGMKCLPKEKLPLADGHVLHDWHAEVLAIRGFNRWLVDECADLAKKGFAGAEDWEHGAKGEGPWVRWRRRRHSLPRDETEWAAEGGQPFELCDGVGVHMYCSEAPCGDASMELTMAAQADATPWTATPPADEMLGRGNFDRLGVVRRKPARPDAPACWSKSCSDKLARRQCTGLLSALVSTLVNPGAAYVRRMVWPESQLVLDAVDRCFGPRGRMHDVCAESVQREWRRDGFAFRPFEVVGTTREFDYSKRATVAAGLTAAPSNLSTLWTPQQQEVLINGVLQGRRQFEPRGASCASRRRMSEAVLAVAEGVGDQSLVTSLRGKTYDAAKTVDVLCARERVKKDVTEVALKGWKRNMGDGDWTI